MTPKKRILLRLSALLLCAAMCVGMAACSGKGSKDPAGNTTGQNVPVQNMTYSVEVKTQGGSALQDISVYVYENDSLQDLIAVLTTDAEGKASFDYQAGNGYVAVLGSVPEGYAVETKYPITGENTQIVLATRLVEGDLNTADYKLGDVMQDFTFTAIDGKEYKLSTLLSEKKAVVLNFWKLDHNPCKMELPYWQEAYDAYADTAAVLAMNPTDSDNEKIAAFVEELALTFPAGACDAKWDAAMHIFGYPTTVVIDRYGIISLINGAAFESATEVQDVLKFFTAEDYVQTVVADYKEILTSEPEDKTDNPVDISGQSSFELTIEPGKIHYLNIHKVSNVWMQVNNPDIFVEYGSKKYTASGGKVGLIVSAPSTFEPAQLGFGNSGTETQTFTVTLSNLPGTQGNPYTLQIGEFTTNVSAGNNQGVYFSYTAVEDGYFSLQCLSVSPNVEYGFSVMNLQTSAMRVLDEEGEVDATTGNKKLTMPMNKGEKLSVIIAALPDDSNNYPAATFKMLAQFTAGDVEDIVVVEKIAYAVTVTDENRNPIPGVHIGLIGTIPEATEPETSEPESSEPVATTPEPNRASLVTDENGVASAYLPKDTYSGTFVIPEGYKASNTSFELTPEAPFVSLKLDTHVVIMEDYTVRVIDEDGTPVPGVLITIGSTYGVTNADGVYTVNLEKGSYTALIGVPDGYTADAVSVPFPENSNVLGITLKKGSGEIDGVEYTVKAVDMEGAPQTDIVVTFYQNGSPVKIVPVDSTGTATAVLKPGRYIVSVTSSSGAALKYDQNEAILTADKTATTITLVINAHAGKMESAYWGNFYRIYTGSAWADLTDKINYCADFGTSMYVFYPSETGVYRFSTTSGVLGYYGTVSYPYGPSKDTNNEDGYFEMTVKEGEFANNNQPALVIGIVPGTGDKDATITVTRVADAPAELPWIVYEPVCTIETFKFSGSANFTYVDLSQTAKIEKKSDGFYYLNGKKLYMNLSNTAPFLTISNMLGIIYDAATGEWGNSSMGTGMRGLQYDGDVVIAVEDYTDCMGNYVRASDPVTGMYPLNDDLIHMVQNCGSYMGWWNIDSPNYLFSTVENMNPEIGWMFAVCTAG